MKRPDSNITQDILEQLPSPCWLLEEELLEYNLKLLKTISEQTDTKILLALKGFSFWQEADMIGEYLDGCSASGLNEALLSNKYFKKETHTYSPAFKKSEIEQIASISNHMIFNTPAQIKEYHAKARESNPNISIGLRVNPESSAAPTELYNPCSPYSRLGTTLKNMDNSILKNIDGLHMHALCEESAESFEYVLDAFESKFGRYLSSIKWVNFGGGHHITKDGYDIEKLILILNNFKSRYPHLELFIEPGEAVGWQSGVLVSTILDIMHNGIDIAILDTSAEAHMPDTIIMPYHAEVRGAADANEKLYTYRLAGNTCLAGDIMGDYSFDAPLNIGDKIIFEDQMHYTMVKSTTFNGISLPSIAILKRDGTVDIVREFDYRDFESRLG